MTLPLTAATNTAKKNNASADYRRQELINATIKAISHYGLSKLTVSKVAKIANLSQGIINFYFKSKDLLLLRTLEHISNEYNQALEAAFSSSNQPLSVLKSIINTSFDPALCSHDKAAVWHAFWSESYARQEYLSICGKQDKAFREKLITLIKQLISDNKTSNINPAAIARGFEGLINDYWQEYLAEPQTFDREQAKQTCLDYLSAFFTEKPEIQHPDIYSKPQGSTEAVGLLAPWTYHNDEFFELEKEFIFKRNWLLVGHISDIPNTGDYLTFDAVGERALIIKDASNTIQAFHNVCRHRGARLVEETQGNCPRALVCPFHGWSYHLDGNVRFIPKFDTFTNLNKESHALVSLSLEIWNGFIFINFTKNTQSLAQIMAPVDHLLSPYKLEEIKPLPGTKYAQERPYNWKIIHDIDNEGYHVPIGHPSLQQLYGSDYEDKVENNIPISFGRINNKPGTLWSVKNYQNILPKFDHLPQENQRLWFYTGIFPSMVIGLYPDMVEFYMSIPKSACTSEYRGGAYALADTRREVKLSRYLTQRINQSTETEDESFMQWIQQGIQSSAFPKLQLSSLEHGLSHLHKQIQQRIPVARLAKSPEPGKVAITNETMQ